MVVDKSYKTHKKISLFLMFNLAVMLLPVNVSFIKMGPRVDYLKAEAEYSGILMQSLLRVQITTKPCTAAIHGCILTTTFIWTLSGTGVIELYWFHPRRFIQTFFLHTSESESNLFLL